MARKKNIWLERSMANLLPLSESEQFADAMVEWRTTGYVVEAEPDEDNFICQLCENESLRSHYGIRNDLNENTLLVGSRCILKFTGISVVDPDTGEIVIGKDRERVLRRQLRRLVSARKKRDKEEAERRQLSSLWWVRFGMLRMAQIEMREIRRKQEEEERLESEREAELKRKKEEARAETKRRQEAEREAMLAKLRRKNAEREATLIILRRLWKRATLRRSLIESVGSSIKVGHRISRRDARGVITLLRKFKMTDPQLEEIILERAR